MHMHTHITYLQFPEFLEGKEILPEQFKSGVQMYPKRHIGISHVIIMPQTNTVHAEDKSKIED